MSVQQASFHTQAAARSLSAQTGAAERLGAEFYFSGPAFISARAHHAARDESLTVLREREEVKL